jgi:hypothetical protein
MILMICKSLYFFDFDNIFFINFFNSHSMIFINVSFFIFSQQSSGSINSSSTLTFFAVTFYDAAGIIRLIYRLCLHPNGG